MLLIESIGFHSCTPSSHEKWTVTEPEVAFAFIRCQTQLKIVVVKRKQQTLIPVELSSASVVVEVLCQSHHICI